MTPSRSEPPFRADHVGSLLRPEALKRAMRAASESRLTPAELTAAEDLAIRGVVAMQEEVGLHSITDGEFRRVSYWSHFVDAVDGLTTRPARFTFHDEAGAEREFLSPHAAGRLARPRSISGHELEFLQSLTRETAKLTLPSPPTMHFWSGAEGIDRDAYPDPEEFFADLARVYRQELADLIARGARYLQLDEVPLAMLCDPEVRERLAAAGEDPETLVDRYVALIGESLPDRPPGVTVAMHLCRGNYKGLWLAAGGYGPISSRLFEEVPVDAYFLEYDSERAGDFEPLRNLPAGKVVVLGLVSSKRAELESSDELCRRIEQASRYTPLEQLAISPQCGFASTVGGNPVTTDVQRRKLELVVAVARRVWGD